jgi:hypothetical protein
MSIDKFGTHILHKFGQKSSVSNNDRNTLSVVNINAVNLYYHVMLPFIASWDESKKKYLLGQDNKEKYVFPFKVGIIERMEFPEVITLNINKNVAQLGMQLQKGDEIHFKKNTKFSKYSNLIYGEILIKCPVEIESSQN